MPPSWVPPSDTVAPPELLFVLTSDDPKDPPIGPALSNPLLPLSALKPFPALEEHPDNVVTPMKMNRIADLHRERGVAWLRRNEVGTF
jgi:hypothetical protein